MPHIGETVMAMGQFKTAGLAVGFGVIFGLIALLLIETMELMGRVVAKFHRHKYAIAVVGGLVLAGIYSVLGSEYSGLGVEVIEASMGGVFKLAMLAFAIKIVATAVTLETGGSGGIVTPLFFIGATSGAAIAHALHLPQGMLAAFGFVAVLAAAANTPIAAAVMGIELLPSPLGVYAALCACTAYLLVGHRSVYASQKLAFSKAAGLEVSLDVPIGDISREDMQVRPGSLAHRAHGIIKWRPKKRDSDGD
jgi:H+/Cl- antiporter ClcA